MLLSLLEVICGILVLWTIISQIVYPGIRGTPLFPFFRNERKLQEEREKVEQEIVEEKLKVDINKAKKEKDEINK